MRRRKRRTKRMLLLMLSLEALLVIGFILYIQLRPAVVKAITIEAGEAMPELDEFLLKGSKKSSFYTDIKSLNLNMPGSYEIQIKIGDKIHTSNLNIIDTVAPTAAPVDQLVLKNEVLQPESLVKDIEDASEVTVLFKQTPNTSILGEQEAIVLLVDSAQNVTEVKVKLTVLDIRSTVTVEAGSPVSISEEDFVDGGKYQVSFITDLSAIDTGKPGIHDVIFTVDGKQVDAKVEIIDSTAPVGTPVDQEIWNDELPPAEIFVTDIRDASEVTASYKTAPDLSKLSVQLVTIELKDASGNSTELVARATVKADKEAPQIFGVSDKTVYIGEAIAYKKGVYATDNKDEEPEIKVDSSQVNIRQEGVYKVVYTATDSSGNVATKEINVTVVKFTVSEEEVFAKADAILARILTPEMSKRDQAYAIYKWIKANVGYNGESDKTDWLKEAYRAMVDGVGDCFTFYAVSEALLTRAGIDNMRVTRVGGRTQHFWNLINCGDGWYHFDSCPHKDHFDTFMLTDKEVEEYTQKRGNNYYTFDKTLYPATPDE